MQLLKLFGRQEMQVGVILLQLSLLCLFPSVYAVVNKT